ncbi:MAG: aminoacyl-tRNA hydrolase [Verrucomicrobiales bacterium]|nr:aminoacyl-tRNA hydrolase [Verrucomicrobiales bacterium]
MSGGNTARKTTEPIRLVVGLGNPGKEYQNTRHNVGFDIVDFLAERSGGFWSKEKKWQAEVARMGDVFLLKPQTFMNLSGRAVAALCRFHKLTAEQILVVYDDLDLGPGRLRLRATGSAAGHNGIKSIIQSLGTQDFARLKFGIGRDVDSTINRGKGGVAGELSNYVLGKFSAAETEELQKRVARAADAVNCALSQGLTAAMNAYNEQAEKKRNQAKKHVDQKATLGTEILAKEKGISES